MKPFRTPLIAALAAVVIATPAAFAGQWFTLTIKPHPYGNSHARSSGVSAYRVGGRSEMAVAQSDLTKAMIAAAKNDPMADEVKTAQAALDKARKDYATALAAGRADLGKYPAIAKMREAVKGLEAQMAQASDAHERLDIAGRLMPARNALNAAEWEVLGVDADLAVSKAAIADALAVLKDTQARRQAQLAADPAVTAARARVASLRQQMSPRR